jgi:tetratricopeptide (TPR) repeat protein
VLPVFRLFLLLAALSCAAASQAFDAATFYGDAWTAGENAETGKLALPLRSDALPRFIDVTSTGDSHQLQPAAEGLAIIPEVDRGTVELHVDLGATEANASIIVAELTQGASLAWRVRGMGPDGGEYLAEITPGKDGWRLRIRVRTAARFVQVPDAVASVDVATPSTLTLAFDAQSLRVSFGGKTLKTAVGLPQGATLALAVSDQMARVRTLEVTATLAPQWKVDAATRAVARDALARLREFSTAGLLSGLVAAGYPESAKELEAYSEAQQKDRARAHGLPPGDRATELMALARAVPKSALASHEAGIAALLAGVPAEGHRLLQRAAKLNAVPVTLLALAEAHRRVGQLDQAAQALKEVKESLPDTLAPEFALIEARLLADEGRLGDAHKLLAAAAEKHPAHEQVAAFAESARMLTQRHELRALSVAGLQGLRLLADIDAGVVGEAIKRVAPYLAQIRAILPNLPETLEGRVVLFGGPVEYLNAALLVAGDNLDNIAGMFVPRGIDGKPTVLACRAFGEDELTRTLVHELWHLCLHATPAGRGMPRWVDEGMAVLLSSGRFRGDDLRFEGIPSEFAGIQDLASVAANPENLARATTCTPSEFYQAGAARAHYAAGWALVWYYSREEQRRALLHKALRGDKDALAALGDDPAGSSDKVGAALKTLR